MLSKGTVQRLQEAAWGLEQAQGRMHVAAEVLVEAGYPAFAANVQRWSDEADDLLGELTADIVGG